MKKVISCCGVICSSCGSFPEECPGCPAIEGKVFWTEYTGEDRCSIYECCVDQKNHVHCGKCGEFPCSRYEGNDPTKTPWENQEDHNKQLLQINRMKELEKLTEGLYDKDNIKAYGCLKELLEISRQSDEVYDYMGQFGEMLESDHSYLRTRGMLLIAANAKWDLDEKIDEIIDEYLKHITDSKPVTARQCIQSLPEIAKYKPELAEDICKALSKADTGRYGESMRPLVEMDIREALEVIGK